MTLNPLNSSNLDQLTLKGSFWSDNAKLQVSVCSGCDLFHDTDWHTHTQTDRQTGFGQFIWKAQPFSWAWRHTWPRVRRGRQVSVQMLLCVHSVRRLSAVMCWLFVHCQAERREVTRVQTWPLVVAWFSPTWQADQTMTMPLKLREFPIPTFPASRTPCRPWQWLASCLVLW